MSEFRKKTVVVEATQWWKNGDHPEDESVRLNNKNENGFRSEGKVVRRYRNPSVSGNVDCHICGKPLCLHGWIDTPEGGYTVCPGDWIITSGKGEYYPCKSDIFAKTYEESHAGIQQQIDELKQRIEQLERGRDMTYDNMDKKRGTKHTSASWLCPFCGRTNTIDITVCRCARTVITDAREKERQ